MTVAVDESRQNRSPAAGYFFFGLPVTGGPCRTTVDNAPLANRYLSAEDDRVRFVQRIKHIGPDQQVDYFRSRNIIFLHYTAHL